MVEFMGIVAKAHGGFYNYVQIDKMQKQICSQK